LPGTVFHLDSPRNGSSLETFISQIKELSGFAIDVIFVAAAQRCNGVGLDRKKKISDYDSPIARSTPALVAISRQRM
jgi:hypothetical protein